MLDICKVCITGILATLMLSACGNGADDPPAKNKVTLEKSISREENLQVADAFTAPTDASISISGGADKDLFELDLEKGVLQFIQAPNFEQPADSDRNNVYTVEYVITTRTQDITQKITVTVEDANDIPVMHTTSAIVEDNDGNASIQIEVTDEDSADVIEYFVKKADLDKYAVDENGLLTFITPPDFEAQPVLEIDVGIYDGVMDSPVGHIITVNITDVDDPPSSPELNISYGIDLIKLNWTDSIGATRYGVMYNPGDGSGFTQDGSYIPATDLKEYTFTASAVDWALASFKIEAINDDDAGVLMPGPSNEAKAAGFFKASNTGTGDQFGQAIALSDDGKIMAVGAWHEDSGYDFISTDATGEDDNTVDNAGAVYIYSKDVAGVWTQEAYIKASNSDAFDEFGWSIDLSADGQTLVVGAPLEDSLSTGINGDESDGCVGVTFECVDSGAVYVYVRNAGVWSKQAYIKASNTGDNDQFGYAVSLSNDGNTLAVGAYRESSNGLDGELDNSANNAGAVYIFNRDAVPQWAQAAYIKASNAETDDFFGFSVSLSGDASTLAVGATNEKSSASGISTDGTGEDLNDALNAGAVYVFTNTSSWVQHAYIKASNTEMEDRFGSVVDLSGDGNVLAVSARFEDSADGGETDDCGEATEINCASASGAAYLFRRDTDVWSQEMYLKASNPGDADNFGRSLVLSSNGLSLLVGSPNEGGDATGVHATYSGSDTQANSGAAYLFKYEVDTWSEFHYIKAANTDAGDAFGTAVAITANGDTLAVAANAESSDLTGVATGGITDNEGATASGAVYLY